MQTIPSIPTNEIFYRYHFCRILCDLCKGWLGGVYFRFFSVPHCLDPTPPHLCSYEETPHLTLPLGTPPFPFGSVENLRSRRVSFQHTFLATTIVLLQIKSSLWPTRATKPGCDFGRHRAFGPRPYCWPRQRLFSSSLMHSFSTSSPNNSGARLVWQTPCVCEIAITVRATYNTRCVLNTLPLAVYNHLIVGA